MTPTPQKIKIQKAPVDVRALFLWSMSSIPCVWLESGVSRVGANSFPWLFGWRMGGLDWLQGGIFLSYVGLTRPSKSGGRSRSSRVESHQTLNSFNLTLNGAAPSPILQPNTETGWLRPQKQKCNQTLDGLALSSKTGLDPTQPTQPPTKHTVSSWGNLLRCLGFGFKSPSVPFIVRWWSPRQYTIASAFLKTITALWLIPLF